MGSNPIRIGVEADVSGLTAFETGATAASNAAQKLQQALSATGVTGKQLANQVIEAAGAVVALQPATAAQSREILNLKTALQEVTSSLKETESIITEAGGETGAATSILERYRAEQQAQIAIQERLRDVTATYRAALQENNAVMQQAAAAAATQATAQRENLASLDAETTATAQAATVQEEYITAIHQAAAADAERIAAVNAETQAVEMQLAANEEFAATMEAAVGAEESLSAASANTATSQERAAGATANLETVTKSLTVAQQQEADTSSAEAAHVSNLELAYQRVAAAQIARGRAKAESAAILKDAIASEGAENIAAGELSVALQNLTSTEQQLTQAETALRMARADTVQATVTAAAATDEYTAEQADFIAAITDAAAADYERVSIQTAEAEATRMQEDAASKYASVMEAALASQQEQTAATTESATAQTTASTAFQRLAAATLENSAAQKELRATLSAATAAEGAEDVSTQELAVALQRAAISTAELSAAQRAANAQFTNMGNAVSYGAGRVASSLVGLGSMGYVLGRVAIAAGAASTALMTLFEFALPILIIAALIEPMEKLFSWLTKNKEAAEKLEIKMNDLSVSMSETADSIELTNLKLEDQIDKLLGVPSHNALQEALLEDEKEVESLSNKFEELLGKEQAALVPSGWQQFVSVLEHAVSVMTEFSDFGVIENSVKSSSDAVKEFDQKLLDVHKTTSEISLGITEGTIATKTGLEEEKKLWTEIRTQAEALPHSAKLNQEQQVALNGILQQSLESIRAIDEEEKGLGLHSQVNTLKSEAEARKEIEERIRKEAQEDMQLFERYEKEKKATIEAHDAEIKSNEDITASVIKLQEVQAREVFRRAETPGEVEAAAIPLINETIAAYDNETDAIQDQINVLNTYKPENYLTKVAELSAQEVVLENEKKTAVLTVENEINEKKREFAKRDFDNQITDLNAEVSAVKEASAAKQVAIEQSLQKKPETFSITANVTGINEAELNRAVAMKTAAAREEYEAVAAYLDDETTKVLEAANAKVITQAEATKKIIEIQKQEGREYEAMLKKEAEARKEAAKKEEQEIDNAAKKMADSFTAAANSVLTGQETIGRGFVKLGQQIELSIIDKAFKKIITFVSTELLTAIARNEAQQTAVHTTGVAQRQITDTTSATKQVTQWILNFGKKTALETQDTAAHATQQTAQTAATTAGQSAQTAAVTAGATTRSAAGIAEAAMEINKAAAVAAADAFKSVMEVVPFPANAAVAPAYAATTFGQVEAYQATLAFERGGVIPGRSGEAVPIIAHAKEMVLPQGVSNFVQNAMRTSQTFANSTATSTTQNISHTNHVRNEFNLYHNGKDAREVLESELVPRIQRAMRNGRLGGVR